VFVLHAGRPVERAVRVGLSDGQRSEVLEGLQEGDTVIVGQAAKDGSPPSRGGPRLRL